MDNFLCQINLVCYNATHMDNHESIPATFETRITSATTLGGLADLLEKMGPEGFTVPPNVIELIRELAQKGTPDMATSGFILKSITERNGLKKTVKKLVSRLPAKNEETREQPTRGSEDELLRLHLRLGRLIDDDASSDEEIRKLEEEIANFEVIE